MTVKVHETDVKDRQGVITIEADTQEEASGSEARELALKEAASNGLSRPGLSGNDSPYPVDSEGETSEDLMMGRGTVDKYRCDYNVTAML